MKEFKVLTTREEAVGKTIKEVLKSSDYRHEYTEVLFHFTDDTYLFLAANGEDEDESLELGVEELSFQRKYSYSLITKEEYEFERKIAEEKQTKEYQEHRRAQYLQLKKIFEPDPGE